MNDRDITLLIRALELDLNNLIQDFYHGKPVAVDIITWARHTIHSSETKAMNAMLLLIELTKKEELS